MTPLFDWQHACAQLSAADEVMAGLIARYQGERLQSRGDAFYTLCRSVAGQQVSVAAADSIWKRVEAAIEVVEPSNMLQMSDEMLRNCGLSRQKIAYLQEIARFFAENAVNEAFFASKSDEEVIKALVSIKGVGKWTAEMFLIFHLQRPDVFPLDDIGVHKALEQLYAITREKDKKTHYYNMLECAERWCPWRSVATWYLWRSLDPIPVEY